MNGVAKSFETMDETPDRNIQEWVRYKVRHKKHRIRLIQPIIIQQFIDEFGFDRTTNKCLYTPAKPDSVQAVDAKNDKTVDAEANSWYQSIAQITNHMTQWSKPEIQNAQHEIL